ncbi:GNAT family N-acetyltransferase [Lysinibacillus sp. FJAT-14745]|uniref:GNAT family N-acetyltransferase n=1 Tax=Lysinibacillus sp. FJAT-14745 TaxID=1704289 RepID=UPI0009EA1C32
MYTTDRPPLKLRAYRRQGIAYEAAYALMNYAFTKIRLSKIIAVVHPKNIYQDYR